MTPNRNYIRFLVLCFAMLSFGAFAQVDSLQQSSVGRDIERWQDGLVALSNGEQYVGEIRCIIKSGTLSEHVEFRREEDDFVQIFMAESCEEV